MQEEDDEEEESNLQITRYPCMPSLVALQQMRNRLHLALLGKKLMKWTALATGRELRRLAFEIAETYKGFSEAMRTAFILIARVRYFYPNLNNIVLENVPQLASISVAASTKSISGVKVLQLEVLESGDDPYTHLGIDKGGQKIYETKKAWLDLIKRLVLMQQQRTSFYQLELAHKSATKKMNMLAKVVVPRIKESVKYILEGLEELHREDLYRLKKVLEVKNRKAKKKEKVQVTTCPVCAKAKMEEELAKAKCIVCGALLRPTKVKQSDKEIQEDEKLEELKTHINEIIDMSKEIEDQGILSSSVDEFLKSAELLKEKLESKEIIGPISPDINIKQLCERCKKQYYEEQAAKKEDKQEAQEPEEVLEEPKTPVVLPTLPPEMESNPPLPLPAPEYCELHQPPYEIDLNLGMFETEIQEITRIVRIKNNDGTITEEKKVVKIKRETNAPVKTLPLTNSSPGSDTNQPPSDSAPSNSYAGKKTIGIVTIDSKTGLRYKQSNYRNANIDIRPESSTNNADLMLCDSSFSFIFKNNDAILEQKMSKKFSLYGRSCSKEELKNILSFITLDIEENEDCDLFLTLSETRLLAKISPTMTNVRISKSANDNNARKLVKKGRLSSTSFNSDAT